MLLKKKQTISSPNNSNSFETVIAAPTHVYGRIVTKTGLRVDGNVSGDIEAQASEKVHVYVGVTGRVEGDIHAHSVVVEGKVFGNIYADASLDLKAGCDVSGNITYGQLGIEMGSKLTGFMISRTGAAPNGPHDASMLVATQEEN